MQVDLLEDQVEELVRNEMRSMISMLSKGLEGGLKNFSTDKEEDGFLTEEYIKAARLVLEYYGGRI